MNITSRAQTEADIRATDFDGTVRTVTIGAETTVGHYEIEPQVELGDLGVIDNVPTLSVPRTVPGLVQDALLTVVGEGNHRILMRLPGSDPGLVKLVLRGA